MLNVFLVRNCYFTRKYGESMFKRATIEDIDNIMLVINKAQHQFKIKNIDQWQNNYPNKKVISTDIEKEDSYVFIVDDKIVGTVYFSFEKEETYTKIYDGDWLSDKAYGVIHRLAVDTNYQNSGIATKILDNIYQLCLDNNVYSIKVDTHQDNIAMQKLLIKEGFIKCGIIYLKDGAKRLAYEKLL